MKLTDLQPNEQAVYEEAKLLIRQYAESVDQNKLEVIYREPWVAGTPTDGRPYPWQVRAHNAGATYGQRAIIAGNRTGKTTTWANEIGCHMLGWYPSWWTGRRFVEPVRGCISGPTFELTRDVMQRYLFGDIGEDRMPRGNGVIPRDKILDCTFRQGVSNVLDTVYVAHSSGGISACNVKSHVMGAIKFQSDEWDFGWLDEEPEDEDIFSEMLMRLLTRDGILMWSRTPLFGMKRMLRHFNSHKPGVWKIKVTMDDSPHITDAMKAKFLDSIPDHERACREKGEALMGSGNVYLVSQSEIEIEPFEIPSHYRRICGIDYGMNHKGAAVWLALNPDTGVVYLYDSYRQSDWIPLQHAEAMNTRGKWIPVSAPHDGLNRESDGRQLRDVYIEAGIANMIHMTARMKDDVGGRQDREPITIKILTALKTGKLKIFSDQLLVFEELRMLHRDGSPPKIIPIDDDIESALRYAFMMLRWAAVPIEMRPTHPARVDTSDYDPHAVLRVDQNDQANQPTYQQIYAMR